MTACSRCRIGAPERRYKPRFEFCPPGTVEWGEGSKSLRPGGDYSGLPMSNYFIQVCCSLLWKWLEFYTSIYHGKSWVYAYLWDMSRAETFAFDEQLSKGWIRRPNLRRYPLRRKSQKGNARELKLPVYTLGEPIKWKICSVRKRRKAALPLWPI